MGLLGVLGAIIIAVGVLGLLHLVALGLSMSVLVCIVGVLLVVFAGGGSPRFRR